MRSMRTNEDRIQKLQGNTLIETLKNVEDEHRNQEYETLTIIDKSGKILLIKDGKAKSVLITPKEREKMQDAIITHNHKDSSCFSPEDIECFVKYGAKEVRATKRDGGVYSLIRTFMATSGIRFSKRYYRQKEIATRKAQRKLDDGGYAAKLRYGTITQGFADREMDRLISLYNSEWLEVYAKHYGYVYSEE